MQIHNKECWEMVIPKKQVTEQEDTQARLAEELLSSLKELEEVLNPILSTWYETAEAENLEKPKELELCQVANRLRFTNERLKNWINLIQELKRRIEL